ncbi:hypothetical protein, partial [Duncaniella muris]|uniref:hypothetical protein n=1 Tax=Duncaniella muris TaxID=2094150 RepID=UPI0025A6500C
MKKYLSTLLLSLCLGMVTVQAASIGEVAVTADSTARKDRFRMLEKPFMLTLSAGANFNTGGRHNSEVFGCRPDAATQICEPHASSFPEAPSLYRVRPALSH